MYHQLILIKISHWYFKLLHKVGTLLYVLLWVAANDAWACIDHCLRLSYVHWRRFGSSERFSPTYCSWGAQVWLPGRQIFFFIIWSYEKSRSIECLNDPPDRALKIIFSTLSTIWIIQQLYVLLIRVARRLQGSKLAFRSSGPWRKSQTFIMIAQKRTMQKSNKLIIFLSFGDTDISIK